MGRQIPELTDEDLERLARLGGETAQIAEAAGVDVAQVRQRLASAPHLERSGNQGRERVGGVVSC